MKTMQEAIAAAKMNGSSYVVYRFMAGHFGFAMFGSQIYNTLKNSGQVYTAAEHGFDAYVGYVEFN